MASVVADPSCWEVAMNASRTSSTKKRAMSLSVEAMLSICRGLVRWSSPGLWVGGQGTETRTLKVDNL